MSEIKFTTQLIGFKDQNIIVNEKIEHVTKGGVLFKRIFGKLTYEADFCPHCHNHNPKTIIKHGTKTSHIKIPTTGGDPTEIALKKQRFLCKECGKTFTAVTKEVDKYCFISNQLKRKIRSALSEKVSEKDIANRNYVSTNTVSRIIDNDFTAYDPPFNDLPEHLCLDEFKSTKRCKGSMSFIFLDAVSHEVIDIVENRQLPFLRRYFKHFTKQSRRKVKTVTIDMYAPYMALIKEFFPNAKIVIDHFHLVQLLTRAMNRTRVDTMKKFSTSSMEYKRLKRYWKLVQKKERDLDGIHFSHHTHFNEWVSQESLVDKTISSDKDLEFNYRAYQALLLAIDLKDTKRLKGLIMTLLPRVSIYFEVALKSILKNIEYVDNLFNESYTNGAIEGVNNFIKVMKRVAFGYKSFFHFRNRILIARKMVVSKELKKAA